MSTTGVADDGVGDPAQWHGIVAQNSTTEGDVWVVIVDVVILVGHIPGPCKRSCFCAHAGLTGTSLGLFLLPSTSSP